LLLGTPLDGLDMGLQGLGSPSAGWYYSIKGGRLGKQENSSLKPGTGVSGSVLFSRFQSLCAVCLFVSTAGTAYAFGVFSVLLQSRLGYSQHSLRVIASVGNAGLYLSFFAGAAVDRVGFRSVVQFGACCISLGYLYLYCIIVGIVPSSVTAVTAAYAVAQVGVCCHISSGVTLAVKLFPQESRGAAVGLVKGYFGLSSAVLADLAEAFPGTAAPFFVLFVALFVPVMGLMGSSLASPLPEHMLDFAYEESRGLPTSLKYVLAHWCALFLSLLVVGYVQHTWESTLQQKAATAVLLVFVVLSLLVIPSLYGERVIKGGAEESASATASTSVSASTSSVALALTPPLPRSQQPQSQSQQKSENDGSETDMGMGGMDIGMGGMDMGVGMGVGVKEETFFDRARRLWWGNISEVEGALKSQSRESQYRDIQSQQLLQSQSQPQLRPPPSAQLLQSQSLPELGSQAQTLTQPLPAYGRNMPISETAFSWRMWSLFLVFMVSSGVGLMVVYNINAIAVAAGLKPSNFLITLIALANGVGRLASGVSSDYLIKQWSFSRLRLLTTVVLAMGCVHLILSRGTADALVPCFLGVGLLFGAAVTLAVAAVADIFGHLHVATNFGLIDTAPVLGSAFFATLVVSAFYRENDTAQVGSETVAVCLGADCYRSAFVINACACCAAAVLCAVLDLKTPLHYPHHLPSYSRPSPPRRVSSYPDTRL